MPALLSFKQGFKNRGSALPAKRPAPARLWPGGRVSGARATDPHGVAGQFRQRRDATCAPAPCTLRGRAAARDRALRPASLPVCQSAKTRAEAGSCTSCPPATPCPPWRPWRPPCGATGRGQLCRRRAQGRDPRQGQGGHDRPCGALAGMIVARRHAAQRLGKAKLMRRFA